MIEKYKDYTIQRNTRTVVRNFAQLCAISHSCAQFRTVVRTSEQRNSDLKPKSLSVAHKKGCVAVLTVSYNKGFLTALPITFKGMICSSPNCNL